MQTCITIKHAILTSSLCKSSKHLPSVQDFRSRIALCAVVNQRDGDFAVGHSSVGLLKASVDVSRDVGLSLGKVVRVPDGDRDFGNRGRVSSALGQECSLHNQVETPKVGSKMLCCLHYLMRVTSLLLPCTWEILNEVNAADFG
jgi:hypothetical protein